MFCTSFSSGMFDLFRAACCVPETEVADVPKNTQRICPDSSEEKFSAQFHRFSPEKEQYRNYTIVPPAFNPLRNPENCSVRKYRGYDRQLKREREN